MSRQKSKNAGRKSRQTHALTASITAVSVGSHSVCLAPSGNPKTGGKTTVRHDDDSGKHGFIKITPTSGLSFARAMGMLGYAGLNVTYQVDWLVHNNAGFSTRNSLA